MTNVWLVLTNPYAYEKALERAIAEAEHLRTGLKVVFLISPDAVSEMVRELADRGWLGAESLRTLQTSMLEGYRALAGDVIEEVRRKAQVELTSTGVVEEPSLERYIRSLLDQQESKLIISGSKLPIAEMESLLESVEWIEEG